MLEDSVKLAVLEQKLIDFAVVVTKLDDAIDKISDVNSNISSMLAVHEERIEQSVKLDKNIMRMIEETKEASKQQHKDIEDRLCARLRIIEGKVEEIAKIKWMTIGMGAILAILATSVATLASGWWPPEDMHTHQPVHFNSKTNTK